MKTTPPSLTKTSTQTHPDSHHSTPTKNTLLVPPPAGMLAEPISGHRPTRALLSLLCFLSLIFLSKTTDELQILLTLKYNFQNSNTNIFDSWTPKQSSACNFTGITCNADQLVTEIDLSDQQLSGTLPLNSICSLQSLEKISLGSNSLYGIITEDLLNCTNLQHLDLGSNFFTGKFPGFSSLSRLRFLNLNNSGFSGKFPWKSLENLTRLEFLSLGDNPFEKNPFPLEVINLDKLYWLYLANCSIEGEIPEGIGNLTLLQNLELSDNYLFGEIPQRITKLKSLWQLELYDNELAGKLPIGFGNLTNLINFDASNNSLEGDLSEIKHLTKIASLQLFENEFSGEIPEEFGEFDSLKEFSLYTNKLTGSLPMKIGSSSKLEFIDVSTNFLTGLIPPDMCRGGKMTGFFLLQNNFTGGLPENYANCSSLNRLLVNNNSLSGEIPTGIWSLPDLSIIDLTWNQFEGPLGSNIGQAKSLAQLFLSHNQFSGELPATISKVSSLVDIQLGSNQFSSEIPATIGDLKRLSNLHLENNLFSGPLPGSLGSCVSLNDMNLAGNSFSGEMPASIGSLRSLNSLNLSDNKLSGEIPESLSSLRLSLLDLSNNRLEGRVPESLSIEAYKSSLAGNPGLCSDNLQNFRSCASDSGKFGHFSTIISCFLAGASVLFVSLGCFIYAKHRLKNQDRPVKQHGSWDMKHFHVLNFSEEEVVDAIRKENLIGKGGSGNVYKVRLGSGKQLAVKHNWKSDSGDWRSMKSSSSMLGNGNLRSPEYEAEVATLSSARHVNVVKLYCSITSEHSNLLVYEYLPNGSLWDRLHTCQRIGMDWDVRYGIAVGAAKGLEYLHHGCDRPVIHRDVKSSNILLDADMKPKIADFGLAKILQANCVKDSTHVIAGTLGYIAPEYAYTCKVNEKSDVYSFGVVLMELVTGKRPIESEFGENKDIVQWVCSETRSRDDVLHLVDSAISEAMKEDAARVLGIAVHCTIKIPARRPSMRMVVQMLEQAEPYDLTGIIVDKDGENNKN